MKNIISAISSERLITIPDHVSPREIDRIMLLGVRYLSHSIGFHDCVGRSHPRVAEITFGGTVTALKTVQGIFSNIVSGKYTDTDIYKIISVDPGDIQETTGDPFSKRRGWVVEGDWDRQGSPFMERVCPKAIKQHYIDQLEWDETILSEHYSGDKYHRRCERIERLYETINSEGYRSQQKLLSQNRAVAWSGLNDAMHPLANEIAVDIGRNGELLWNMCGQHRLATAKILEIDRIPVQVFRRHRDWQTIRDRARRGDETPESVRDHPDLTDILKSE